MDIKFLNEGGISYAGCDAERELKFSGCIQCVCRRPLNDVETLLHPSGRYPGE